MTPLRRRAREQFPMVLLTLLSIVQALALELLWAHVRDDLGPARVDLATAIEWVQIAASFIGLVVIWLIYASTVLRFSWVPSTADSVYPFCIGVLQFQLVECLGAERVPAWFVTMALVYALMTWVAHSIFRKARRDPENAHFFDMVAPARLRDFRGHITAVALMLAAAGFSAAAPGARALQLIALLGITLALALQIVMTDRFWRYSMALGSDAVDP